MNNNRKKKSILVELIIPLIVAFVIATVILVLVVNENQKNVRGMLESLRNEMITLVQRELNIQMEKAIQLNKINENAYHSGILNTGDPSNRERYFAGLIKEFDDVAMTYIGLETGEFYGARRNIDGTINIVRNNKDTLGHSEYYSIDEYGNSVELLQVFENFDPRIRPWYEAANQNQQIVFSGIYSHFVFKEPTLTASIPIFENGLLIGVVGVDYLMTGLNKTLAQLPIGENGQVFIIDDQGQLIATTTGESIFNLVDGTSQNKFATDSTNSITQETMLVSDSLLESTLPEVRINGMTYMIGKDKFEFYGNYWDIYTVILEDDFFADKNLALFRTLAGGLLITLIFMSLIFFVIRSVIRPILQLNESAKKLSQGISVEVPLGKQRNEIYELTRSFNEMSTKIVNQVDQLEAQVKLRTIELEEKNEMLSQLSYKDELMGIGNRRHLDVSLDQALELASRNNLNIGVMMLDIDNFKDFNDSYGHIEGDECLRKIGKALKRCVHRKSDLVARYGGEEMVVVLQDTTKESLLKVAENIRLEIHSLMLPNENTKLGVVTVSIGAVLCKVKPKQTADEVLHVADQALYEAKANGKNRVEFEEMSKHLS
ncbi:MAG: diguanylate cyclase [Clostridiales bacterium]|nr:diguanylate cyclase [Clostridiales bacterium]